MQCIGVYDKNIGIYVQCRKNLKNEDNAFHYTYWPYVMYNLKHQVRNTPHSFIINISTVKYKYINIYRSTLSINKIKQQIVH